MDVKNLINMYTVYFSVENRSLDIEPSTEDTAYEIADILDKADESFGW